MANPHLGIINLIQNLRGRKYLEISSSLCVGCDKCKNICPANAISGNRGEVHSIDNSRCHRCYHCKENCPKQAIHPVA